MAEPFLEFGSLDVVFDVGETGESGDFELEECLEKVKRIARRGAGARCSRLFYEDSTCCKDFNADDGTSKGSISSWKT